MSSNETFNGKVLQALDRKADVDLLNVTDEKLAAKIETSISALETAPGSTVRFIHITDENMTPALFSVGSVLYNTSTLKLYVVEEDAEQTHIAVEVPTVVREGVTESGIWYKQYSNGVLEQGGTTEGTGEFGSLTVTLPFEFRDTDYTVSVNTIVSNANMFTDMDNVGTLAYAADMYGVVAEKSVGSFKISSKSSHSWVAKGLA